MQDGSKRVLELLEKSGSGLHALLTRLTLREDVAEDLMQELFIKLVGSKTLGRVTDLAAYARRAAINLAFDWRKSRRNCARLDEIAEPSTNDHAPAVKLIRDESLEQVLDAIGRLGATYRQAVVMRYIEQDSYEHIAEQMGRNPHQVRALCSKGLGKVRDVLGGAKGGGNAED